jgi:ribosome-associated heat shock protein Hsp15
MTTGRLDVWLWSVRLFKTRSAANKAVAGGHVRLNGSPAKPAHAVKPGDVVTVREPGWERKFEITQVIMKRVGAPVAQTCYVDHSPPRPAYLSAPMARRDRGAGRPTKKDRRDIDRLRGRADEG